MDKNTLFLRIFAMEGKKGEMVANEELKLSGVGVFLIISLLANI